MSESNAEVVSSSDCESRVVTEHPSEEPQKDTPELVGAPTNSDKSDVAKLEHSSVVQLFENGCVRTGKSFTISKSNIVSVERSSIPNTTERERINEILTTAIAEDPLLDLVGRMYIAVFEATFSRVWKIRIFDLITDSLKHHPMLSVEIYRTSLWATSPDLKILFSALGDSITRFTKEKDLGKTEIDQLRTNSTTIFLLIFSLRNRWDVETFIRNLDTHLWRHRHPIDIQKSFETIALISATKKAESTAAVAHVLRDQIDRLTNELSKAQTVIDQNFNRALQAENQVTVKAAQLTELEAKITQLDEEIVRLYHNIETEKREVQNAKSHHVDDFETLKTRVVRLLARHIDLLNDGLHALRDGEFAVADEFLERTAASFIREHEQMKNLYGGK